MSRRRDGVDYTDVVYRVLRHAHTPLALDGVVAAVQHLESVSAANPKALILHILEQSPLIQQTVDGRYGYLPQLLEGNTFRLPLAACHAEQGLVELSPEVLAALCPGRVEAQRQRESRCAELILPRGARAIVHPFFHLPATWGFTAGPELFAWLAAANHRPLDDLIIRVVDSEARRCAAELAHRERSGRTAMAARSRRLADRAARAVGAAGGEVHLHRLATMLIAEGAYRDAVPPDPLNAVLARDDRFVDAGAGLVALSSVWREKVSAWPLDAPHPLLQEDGLR